MEYSMITKKKRLEENTILTLDQKESGKKDQGLRRTESFVRSCNAAETNRSSLHVQRDQTTDPAILPDQ